VTALITCAAAAAVTWLLRILPITVAPATRLPTAVQRCLPHVAPAVLAALTAAAVLGAPAGATPAFLTGALVTGLVAWRSHGIVLPVAAGLIAVAVAGAVG
jgi:branched-subunit amino acid transport protein